MSYGLAALAGSQSRPLSSNVKLRLRLRAASRGWPSDELISAIMFCFGPVLRPRQAA